MATSMTVLRRWAVTVVCTGLATAASATPALGLDDGFACTTPSTATGVAQVGRTLTAVPGEFVPADEHQLTYQWRRHDPTLTGPDAWTSIDDARGSTYDVTGADLGHTLAVDVTGVSAHGDATCGETQTEVVVAADGAWIGTPPGPVAVPRSFAVGRVGRPSGRAVVGGVPRLVRLLVRLSLTAPGYSTTTVWSGRVLVR